MARTEFDVADGFSLAASADHAYGRSPWGTREFTILEFSGIEEYRQYPGYGVDASGKFFSCRTQKSGLLGRQWKQIKPYCSPGNSYLMVGVKFHDGEGPKRKNLLLHSLVCRIYHGERPADTHAHHVNHSTKDNRKENLIWVDKTIHMSEMRPNARITREVAAEIRGLQARGWKRSAIADRLGLTRGIVQRVCTGESWRGVPADHEAASREIPGQDLPLFRGQAAG
jgi:hypothetical protein